MIDNSILQLLLVEDNEDDVFFIRKALRGLNCVLDTITDGKDAYEYLLNPKVFPDIILLDNHLPQMNGLEILRSISAANLNYAFIFLTVDNSLDTVKEAMKAGALDFIPKSADLRTELPLLINKVYRLHKDILDKRRIEEELRRNEEKWNSLIANASDIIFIVNSNAQIQYLNRNTLSGQPQAQILGKYIYDIFESSYQSTFLNAIHESFKGKVTNFEALMILNNGTKKWFSISTGLVKESNTITGVSLISTDITDRKMFEGQLKSKNEEYEAMNEELREINTRNSIINQQLNESKDRYLQLFENSMAGIAMVTTDGQVIDCNASFARIFGYSIDEMKSINASALYLDQKDRIRMIEDLETFKILRDREVKMLTKSGKVVYLFLNVNLITIDGQVVLLSNAVDITDRRIAEESLLKSEETFRAIAENSPDVIARYDREFRHLYINKNVEKLSLLKASDYIGKTHAELGFPEELCKYFTKQLSEVFIYKHIDEQVYTFPTPVGDIIFDWRLISEFDADGQVQSVLSVSRDITQQKKNELDLIRAKEKAEESDRLKSAFLANMSHEVRTPMNGIIGFANLLKLTDITPDKRNRYIEIIEMCSQQLLSIVTDIVDISKIESGLINLIIERCNLNRLMHELLDFYETEKEKKEKQNINLSLKVDFGNSQSEIMTDKVRLHQILSNLIGNALKFTEEGHVEFGYILNDPDNLLFYVKDTGIGIPQGKQNIIFERFRQGDETLSRKYGGTGLGLAISKGLVSLFDGEIWFESEENKGSVFYFTIPYHAVINEKPSFQEEIPLTPQKYNWKNKKILVVEDTALINSYLKEIFVETQATVIFTETGEESVDYCLKNDDVSIVLMDIQLPDISGYEAAQRIRAFKRHLPIIAQTAYALTGDRERAITAGCNDYITKPIIKDNLFRMIAKYI